MMNEQTEINLAELRSSPDDGESCAVHAFSHDHFGRAHPRLFVASLIGDVAQAPSRAPTLHIHVVVGKRDGTAMVGHLAQAV